MQTIPPFREFVEHMDALELRKQDGEFNSENANPGFNMIKTFISDIGIDKFIEQSQDSFVVMEIAKFYENPLKTEQDVLRFYDQLEANHWHQEAFVRAMIYAAWYPDEVADEFRDFKDYDEEIKARIEQGGSI